MPQQAWSDKDERQYEHIKESSQERGESTRRAKEIAARTVNKRRREEGRTKSQRGRSGGARLEDRTRKQLYERARELDIEGRSKMNKDELVHAIREAS